MGKIGCCFFGWEGAEMRGAESAITFASRFSRRPHG